jgi:hypothetical protein
LLCNDPICAFALSRSPGPVSTQLVSPARLLPADVTTPPQSKGELSATSVLRSVNVPAAWNSAVPNGLLWPRFSATVTFWSMTAFAL